MMLREPRDGDAPAIAGLLGQLGYPSVAQEVTERLAALRKDAPNSRVWVAELDGKVVGVASVKKLLALHVSTPVAYLTALVVDERVRGQGVGQRLVAEAEAWAKSIGSPRLTLTSATHRKEAHEFYIKLGYQQTGVRLAKTF